MMNVSLSELNESGKNLQKRKMLSDFNLYYVYWCITELFQQKWKCSNWHYSNVAYNVAFYFLCEDVKILSAAEKVASLLPNPEAPLGGTDRPPSFFCFVLFFKFFIVLYEHNNFCNTIQVFNTTCATMLYFNVFFLCYCWSTQLCCSKLSENLRNLTGGQEIEKISKKKHIKLAAVQDI